MTDVADQIRAWADAVAPEDAAPTVRADEVVSIARRSAKRPSPRLLAVAAVVVFVAALAGVIVATNRDDSQSVTAGPTEDTVDANPVTFDVLSVSDGEGLNDLGVLRAAGSASQLAAMWEVAGGSGEGRAPSVDFDQQVVVSITIPGSSCAPTLEAFERDGSTVAPQFVEPDGVCRPLQQPWTYVVALDRATTGPSFRLVLSGPYEFGDTYLDVGGVVPGMAGATAIFRLVAETMPAGGSIAGTVQVYNNGDAIETTTCGSYFVVVLRNETTNQSFVRPACAEPFVITPGVSSYPVTASGKFRTCINGEPSGAVPVCLPDGSMPALPAGIYEASVNAATDVVPVDGPITVTVT